MCSSTPKVLHTRRYARHWAEPTSVSTTASDCKVKWYSERIPTDIVATNTSGHSHIPVPRPHRNEWINWRKPVSAANSRDTMAVASSSLATLPKPRHYLRKSARMLSSHIRRGCQSKYKQRKEKSVVLDNSGQPTIIYIFGSNYKTYIHILNFVNINSYQMINI